MAMATVNVTDRTGNVTDTVRHTGTTFALERVGWPWDDVPYPLCWPLTRTSRM